MTTREDIIRMAREAGMKASVGKTDKDGVYHPFINALGKDVPIEWLERFFELASAAEREACAKVCEELRFSERGPALEAKRQRDLCAMAIRARGQS